ncbi:MAG TPA: alkaline phosphatase family protein [Actinomycetota bacterium]|nr:alkaline phosphatase family protein [Actinomycetota bacterium]
MVQEGRPATDGRSSRSGSLTRRVAGLLTALVVATSLAGIGLEVYEEVEIGPVPSFREQACSLPAAWLERTRRGFYEPRSGQISLLPKTPAYMASGGDGWSHSGPWPYLQDVPLVFYGPGIVPRRGEVTAPATTADVAPTTAALLGTALDAVDGEVLRDVVPEEPRRPPALVLTIVWDGGGWNTLRQWPEDWPNLARLMRDGVSFRKATVGSSPSVTPAVHSTLGTGSYPWTAGVTGVPVRDEEGEVVDAFLEGESSRFLQLATFGEMWDERHSNRALVGMLGYEPWHLGMIGQGAERPGGDKDDAVWLNVETNEWITNPAHYTLPPAVTGTGGLEKYLDELDAADGAIDRSWRDNAILDAPDRIEETPAFIRYHTDALLNLVRDGGYGDDAVADLLFTNYKQIDRVGHYFNMASAEVRDSLVTTDEELGRIVDGLDAAVGRGRYVVVVTADHGQQPDAAAVDGFGIDPNEVERDIDAAFGPISDAVWPTEVFLDDEALESEGVTVAEVARWLGDYRVEDNEPDDGEGGRFRGADRVFALAIPATELPQLDCG